MMDIPGGGSCCCNNSCGRCRTPICRDNGVQDVCKGIQCVIGGFGKGVCCGLDVLTGMGNCLLAGPRCQPRCRPKPRPQTCRCRCVCVCKRTCC
ncbi:MAG: hypothetical protein FWE40_00890 [Oscillospiraceae bacterium]|nr:hypothetical protein [Oscillospiraceae bacterium]